MTIEELNAKLVEWIDETIDTSLKELRKIVADNPKTSSDE